ncbi:hypothetical protein A2U01_0002922, partial [Trifolium medium]|nr:hypothetical protein [Trifolium medium]
ITWLIKIAADQKGPKKTKKKVKSRASVVLEQSGSGGSSSLGGVSSSQGGVHTGSPVVREPPAKKQREDPFIDIDALEQPFLLPRCFSSRGFMENHPPMVADVERAIILDLGPAARQDRLVQDIAAVMRLLETALVLNNEKDNSTRDLEKLKFRNEKLEAEAKKLREMQAALGKAEKDLGDMRTSHAEEKKKLKDEIRDLKLAMTPAADEAVTARDLTTRAELVERIKKLGQDVFIGAKHSWENAFAQL